MSYISVVHIYVLCACVYMCVAKPSLADPVQEQLPDIILLPPELILNDEGPEVVLWNECVPMAPSGGGIVVVEKKQGLNYMVPEQVYEKFSQSSAV